MEQIYRPTYINIHHYIYIERKKESKTRKPNGLVFIYLFLLFLFLAPL